MIKNKIEQAISEGLFSACVVGVVRADGWRSVVAAGGYAAEDGLFIKIGEDAIFDVASVTKSIPTSSLALKSIDEGLLRVDDQLIKYVPEFRNSDREKVLIKHLLTQTLDYGFRLSDYRDRTPEEILEVIFSAEFKSSPGTKFYYTNATSILLGLVVEKVFGKTLGQLGDEHFFKPLGMERTTFKPLEKFGKDEIVPTEIQDWRGGLVHGEVHDESAYVLGKKTVVGSAGLFSTAPDLLNFLEMLLNNGVYGGKKYFSSKIMEQSQANQLDDLGLYAGLGWELNQPRYMGNNCSDKTFGKTGFTGCSAVCDIPRKVGFTILSNFTYPTRKADSSSINKFRSDIANIIFEHLNQ